MPHNSKKPQPPEDYTKKQENKQHTRNEHFNFTHDEPNSGAALFRGVRRRRAKAIVLYNVEAIEKVDVIAPVLKEYAKAKHVSVTMIKLIKLNKSWDGDYYTLLVNMDERDYYNITDYFWPDDITWREFVPKRRRIADDDNKYDTEYNTRSSYRHNDKNYDQRKSRTSYDTRETDREQRKRHFNRYSQRSL